MARAWYVIQTYFGYEAKIEKHLRRVMDQPDMVGYLYDIKIPTEEITEVKDGKKKTKTRLCMPGYILLEMDLSGANWKAACSTIRRIDGVSGFVGQIGSQRPQAITNDEMKVILQRSGELKVDKSTVVNMEFAVGETVRIIDGPFDTFEGKIEDVYADKAKLRVMVQIFSRSTPVEVSYTQVEKI